MKFLIALALVLAAFPAAAQPLVIAHRGASGERPEHTLAAYRLAIQQGADFIEPDLVATKDGVLVARHENEISQTTDVARRREFVDRRRTKTIDGEAVSGWFTEDFTLAELKTLRARERLPGLRPASAAFDGREQIPTLQEVIDLAREEGAKVGRRVGLYPELKHPAYFTAAGLPLEARLLERLKANGLDSAGVAVFIQCFEAEPLKALKGKTKARLVQLISADQAHLISPEGLKAIAAYADAIGVEKVLLSPELVARAHGANLAVHAWTYRAENVHLPPAFRRGSPTAPGYPAMAGDLAGEITAALAMGVDGVFTDFPAQAHAARRAFDKVPR